MPRSLAACALIALALIGVGCAARTSRNAAVPDTYSEMKVVADRYADVEIERFTSGYFGRPLVSPEGAHVSAPVPIYSIDPAADSSQLVRSRLATPPHAYVVAILNSDNEILGEYVVAYDPESDTWVAQGANRRGILARNLEAKRRLGVSTEASSTLVDHGAVWSIVSSRGVEAGVAPRVFRDHNAFDRLPQEGHVYAGEDLLQWFSAEASGQP